MHKFAPIKIINNCFVLLILFFSLSLRSEEIIHVPLNKLFPTQAVISHDQVTRKLAKYVDKPARFQNDLKSSPLKTVVIGPQQKYYLTDGHHTFSAMYDYPLAGPEYKVPVNITHDMSQLSIDEFWLWMQESNLTWLKNPQGEAITYKELPQQLGQQHLKNDIFRGAVYFLRGHFWNKPSPAIPFVEFYWAQYFRQVPGLQPPHKLNQSTYMTWLKKISEHMQQIPKHIKIGPKGEGADDLGRLPVRALIKPIFDYISTSTEKDLVDVVIEIPAGSDEKWQVSKTEPDFLEWEKQEGLPRKINYLPYPFNYGSLPGTLSDKSEGGDGDPMDVIVLGKALPHGALLNVRIIGQLVMLDNGEQDHKFIAVLPDVPPFSSIKNINQLATEFPGMKNIISTWFFNYKGKKGTVTGLAFKEIKQ